MSKNGEEEKTKKLEVQSVGGGNATFLLIEIVTFQVITTREGVGVVLLLSTNESLTLF